MRAPAAALIAAALGTAMTVVATTAATTAAAPAVAIVTAEDRAALTPPAGAATPVPERSPVTAHEAVLYRVRAGATLDLGWTGISHGQPWTAEQDLGFVLDCPAGETDCAVTGGEPGVIFGAPVAVSSGGIPVCVVSRLRAPLEGSVNVKTGCGKIRLRLTSSVFMGPEVARPCPVCQGDRTAHDRKKDGHCEGGTHPGAPCDAESASALFGASSNDCPPLGTSVGDLAIDLLPMTTGALRSQADTRCKRTRPGLDDKCYCADQPQPNACDTGTCGADGICGNGPFDGSCSKAPYRGCNDDADCDQTFPGAGVCKVSARRCFGTTILARGTCSPTHPTYVALFCAPATQAPAVNTSAGLPGPARLLLPLERVEPAAKATPGAGKSRRGGSSGRGTAGAESRIGTGERSVSTASSIVRARCRPPSRPRIDSRRRPDAE